MNDDICIHCGKRGSGYFKLNIPVTYGSGDLLSLCPECEAILKSRDKCELKPTHKKPNKILVPECLHDAAEKLLSHTTLEEMGFKGNKRTYKSYLESFKKSSYKNKLKKLKALVTALSGPRFINKYSNYKLYLKLIKQLNKDRVYEDLVKSRNYATEVRIIGKVTILESGIYRYEYYEHICIRKNFEIKKIQDLFTNQCLEKNNKSNYFLVPTDSTFVLDGIELFNTNIINSDKDITNE